MSYIPFARKWRPQNFQQIVGQQHITTTLSNAISQKRTASAYLFTGPRGVGKTSTARIFAKSLNCEKGPTITPCNKCSSCNEITAGNNMDVIEIDGASNRGIDEVRELRENVKFAPNSSTYKIYIIDEVHMLTSEAFNALLKTLEEPPEHVKFIFATTLPHKVLPTILSRCQRFDFKRIATSDVVEKLKEIVKAEKLEVEEGVFFEIARVCDGSLRDGESVLDQLVSFAKDKVRVEDVISVLGIVDKNVIFNMAQLIIDKRLKELLILLNDIVKDGKDLGQVILRLMEHFRDLMIVKTAKDSKPLVNAPGDWIEEISKQTQDLTIESIIYIFNVISNTAAMVKRTGPVRIIFEMTLAKLCLREDMFALKEILGRIEELEKRIQAVKKKEAVDAGVIESSELPVETTHDLVHDTNVEFIKKIWDKWVQKVKSKKISVGSFFAEGEPFSIDGNKLIISFPKECKFHMENLNTDANKRLVSEMLREICDRDFNISFKLIDNKDKDAVKIKKDEGFILSNPIVARAVDIFNGNIVHENL